MLLVIIGTFFGLLSYFLFKVEKEKLILIYTKENYTDLENALRKISSYYTYIAILNTVMAILICYLLGM
ncbi:MAG: hypothetical protein RR645_07705 [Clostridium sp.]